MRKDLDQGIERQCYFSKDVLGIFAEHFHLAFITGSWTADSHVPVSGACSVVQTSGRC